MSFFTSLLSVLQKKDLLLLILASSFYDCLLYVSYINVYINDVAKTAFMISAVFTIRRFTRIVLDIPVGIFIDKKLGLKGSIYIAIILKIMFLFFFITGTIEGMLFGAFLEGLSILFFRGKINVLHYEFLSQRSGSKALNSSDEFVRFNIFYNVIIYIITIIFGLISNYIYQLNIKDGYYNLTIISVLMLVLDLFLFKQCLLSVKSSKEKNLKKKKDEQQEYVKINFRIKKYLLFFISKKNKKIIGTSITLGICSLSWQLNTMNQFFMLKTKSDSVLSARFFQLSIFAMLCGAVLNWFLKDFKSYSKMFLIFLLTVIINIFSVFFKESYAAFVLIFPYLLFFTSFETMLRAYIISNCQMQDRNFVISISTTITSVASLISTYLFHYIGTKMDYYSSYAIVFGLLTVVSLYGFKLFYTKE